MEVGVVSLGVGLLVHAARCFQLISCNAGKPGCTVGQALAVAAL